MTKNEREIGGVESSTCYLPVRYRQPWLWNEYCNKGRRAGGEMLAAAGCWLTALRVVFPTPMNRNSLLASTKILIQIFGGADISYDGIQYSTVGLHAIATSHQMPGIRFIPSCSFRVSQSISAYYYISTWTSPSNSLTSYLM